MERSTVDMANFKPEVQPNDKQKEYDDMVYAAFSSPSGKDDLA